MASASSRASASSSVSGSAAQDLVPPSRGIAANAVGVALISCFLFGYSICVLNSCAGIIAVVFQWCNSDWQPDCLASRVCQGLVNASVYLGAAAGALLVGRRKLQAGGCRYQIIISDGFFILGGLLGTFAQGFNMLILCRLFSGIGLGISAIAAPVYIAEISPRERRGTNSAKVGVFIAVGIFFSITFGLMQDPPPSSPEDTLQGLNSWYWRLLLSFPVLLALIQAALFTWVVPIDPPSFLVQQGRISEARSLLYRIYGQQTPEQNQVAKIESQMREMIEAAAEASAIPQIYIYQAISDPFFRCPLFLGFGLAAFQQLCGINALMSYSNNLFSEAGIPASMLTFASCVMAGANVLVSVLSSTVVDNWGRRKLLLLGSLLQAVAMAVICLIVQYLPESMTGAVTVVSFSLFVVSFSAGLGAITWLYLSEIYPIEIRGAALSTCGVINWLSCFTVVFGARFLSLQSSCAVFGIISFTGWLGIWLWVVETKGCSMDDSPLTPRSARHQSQLLTPTNSPRVAFEKMPSDKAETLG